jgi:hypothetical protein
MLGGYPPMGNIEVYLVADVPNSTDVLDAEAANLTDSEYISQALVEADLADKTEIRNKLENSNDTATHSRTDSTAGELNESDDGSADGHRARTNGARVARINSEEIANREIFRVDLSFVVSLREAVYQSREPEYYHVDFAPHWLTHAVGGNCVDSLQAKLALSGLYCLKSIPIYKTI